MSERAVCRLAVVMPFALLVTGCGYINAAVPNLNLPEANLSTTGMGAVAGATIGAGLGAVAGASTGNVAEGLLVGSVAGAATGGLIGNQFEKQEARLAKQEEILIRHREKLSSQEREIQELKKENEDFAIPPKNVPSPRLFKKRGAKTSNAKRPALPASLPLAKRPVSGPTPRAPIVIDLPITKKPGSPKSSLKRRIDSGKQSIRARLSKPVTKKPAAKTVKSARGALKPIARKPQKTPIKVGSLSEAAAKLSSDASSTSALTSGKKVQSSKKSEQCTRAEEEAARARSASSAADRLFYFRRALRLCPEDPTHHVEIGMVYADIGRKEDAEFEFRKALDLDPENAQAHEQLGLLESDDF